MQELIKVLIEVSPYAGFVVITILCMNRVYKGYREDLKQTFDTAIAGIKEAYKESASDSRQIIKLFAEKIEKNSTT